MSGYVIKLKGVKLKDGKKIEPIAGYRLDTSAKIRQKKSKRVRVVKRAKT